jgi:hypothetical protein
MNCDTFHPFSRILHDFVYSYSFFIMTGELSYKSRHIRYVDKVLYDMYLYEH